MRRNKSINDTIVPVERKNGNESNIVIKILPHRTNTTLTTKTEELEKSEKEEDIDSSNENSSIGMNIEGSKNHIQIRLNTLISNLENINFNTYGEFLLENVELLLKEGADPDAGKSKSLIVNVLSAYDAQQFSEALHTKPEDGIHKLRKARWVLASARTYGRNFQKKITKRSGIFSENNIDIEVECDFKFEEKIRLGLTSLLIKYGADIKAKKEVFSESLLPFKTFKKLTLQELAELSKFNNVKNMLCETENLLDALEEKNIERVEQTIRGITHSQTLEPIQKTDLITRAFSEACAIDDGVENKAAIKALLKDNQYVDWDYINSFRSKQKASHISRKKLIKYFLDNKGKATSNGILTTIMQKEFVETINKSAPHNSMNAINDKLNLLAQKGNKYTKAYFNNGIFNILDKICQFLKRLFGRDRVSRIQKYVDDQVIPTLYGQVLNTPEFNKCIENNVADFDNKKITSSCFAEETDPFILQYRKEKEPSLSASNTDSDVKLDDHMPPGDPKVSLPKETTVTKAISSHGIYSTTSSLSKSDSANHINQQLKNKKQETAVQSYEGLKCQILKFLKKHKYSYALDKFGTISTKTPTQQINPYNLQSWSKRDSKPDLGKSTEFSKLIKLYNESISPGKPGYQAILTEQKAEDRMVKQAQYDEEQYERRMAELGLSHTHRMQQ